MPLSAYNQFKLGSSRSSVTFEASFVSSQFRQWPSLVSLRIATPIAPSRMFKALILDSHNLIPGIAPQGIKSIDFVEGEGGVGRVKQINFAEGSHLKYLKHRINALDAENLVCKYTLIEANVVFDKIESVAYEVKFEASGNGGCMCKMASKCRTKAGAELKEEDIKQWKDKAMGLSKVVEEYLRANPSVYA